jgi:hypothetical protein
VVATRGFVDWLQRAGLTPRITVVRPAPRTSTTPIDPSEFALESCFQGPFAVSSPPC